MTKKHPEHEDHEHHTKHAAPTATDPIFSDPQTVFVRSLKPVSSYDVRHTQKVAPDVGTVFTPAYLQAIEANPSLGGPARAQTIQALLDQQAQLLVVSDIVTPIEEVVAQNLMMVNSQLGQQVAETVKIAKAQERTDPSLIKAMKSGQDWEKEHHGGRHAAKDLEPAEGNPLVKP